MMERYENPHYVFSIDQLDFYAKLHDEVILFRDSVKDILHEMEPIKEHIIQKITAVVKKCMPNCDVKVYGSHATQLCLPWSDIDLVIIPAKTSENQNSYMSSKNSLSQIAREL